MQQIVKMLIVCLAIISFSGCSEKVEYIKCKTPDVLKPHLDNTHYDNILDNAKKCLRNYGTVRAYSLELEKANSVCK